MKHTDTPRTDAALKATSGLFRVAADCRFATFARELERENTKLRADGELVDYLCKLHGCDRKMVLHWCEFAARKSL